MKEVKCPNCGTIVNVKDTARDVVCPKCLDTTGKTFIMIESPDAKVSTRYLGDGLFERL
jgi:DNA-directed RNA polymerase subunit RPC12/RpoP